MKKDLIISLGMTLILVFFTNYFQVKPETAPTIKIEKTKPKEKSIPLKFGIPYENFYQETHHIETGMYLSTLFKKYNVSGQRFHKILEKTKPVFDVRKIKRGNIYHAFLSPADSSALECMIYEINAIDYLIFDLRDSISVQQKSRPTKISAQQAGGVINGALWFALKNADVNPLMANKLSSIYAWTIDFFALQKGDEFKMLWDELTVENKIVGTGEIEAAFFKHYGDSVYAIPFMQDSILSFYNIDGSALKKEFLKAPLSYSRISSGFSHARRHPILKIVRPHHGVDYAAPAGTPVYALGDGTVFHASYTGGAGHYIKIRHNSVYTTGYMHLRSYAKGIHSGVRVKQGQVIGYVGSTGLSTGAHLDFRVWKNGRNINPLHLKSPPVEPIREENMKEFSTVAQHYKIKLDRIKIKPVTDNPNDNL